MTESLKDALLRKFDDGIQKVEKEKTMEGLEDIRNVLGTSWLLERNSDALVLDFALFTLESRIKKLKDNKDFIKKWSKTLQNLRTAFETKNELSLYQNIKEMTACIMTHVPKLEE